MKKKSVYFIILVMLCFADSIVAQSKSFPDSIVVNEFTKFIQKHIRYSAIDKENNVSGHVIVNFDVIEGVIINPKVERSLSVASDGEVLRCIAAYNKNNGMGLI